MQYSGAVSSSEQPAPAAGAASSPPSAATAFAVLDDERQDGYHRKHVKTYAPQAPTADTENQPGLPATGSAVGLQDAAGLTFSAFMTALTAPRAWLHPADATLVIPIYADDAASAGQQLAEQDVKRAMDGRTTRGAFESAAFHPPAAGPSPRPTRSKDADTDRSTALLPVDPNVGRSARQRRSVSPSASAAAVKNQQAESVNGFHPKEPQPAAITGHKRPRSSAGSAQRSPRTAEAARRSRERSASRGRAFAAAHSQLQWQRLPLGDDKDGASARNRRAQQYRNDDAASAEPTGFHSSDEEEAGMDDLSRCLLHRKKFSRRMGREKLRLQDLLSGFGYAVRLEQDEDEAERIAYELEAEKHPELQPLAASADKDSKRRSRRRNKEEEQRWMRQSNAFIKADIDRIRRAALQQQAELQPTASVGSAGSSSVPSGQPASAPSSPASLVSLSPPSSRSVSPLPGRSRSRSNSRSRSPSVPADFDAAVQCASKQQRKPSSHSQSQAALYHTPPALAGLRHSKQLVRLLCDDAAVVEQPSTYVVEAIIDHRRAAHQQRPAADPAARRASICAPLVKAMSAWESDWRDWRAGVQFEYEVKWLGFRQPTWEPQRGLGPFLVDEYWKGRGTTLWSEEEVDNLRRRMEEASRDRQHQPQHQQQQQQQAQPISVS